MIRFCSTRAYRLAAVAALVLASSASVRAASFTWDGTNNNWATVHWFDGTTYVAGRTGNGYSADTNLIASGTVTFPSHDTFDDAGIAASPLITVTSGGMLASANSYTTITQLVLSGGTLMSNGGANSNYGSFGLTGTVNVSGSAASYLALGTGNYNRTNIGANSAGGTTTFNVADVTGNSNPDLTVQTGLQNYTGIYQSHVTKAGAGTMVLTGSNIYTGATLVSGGTLSLAAGGSLNGVSNIRTQAGGVLSISGTVTQATNSYFATGNGISGTTGTIRVENGAVVNLGGNAVLIGGSTSFNGQYGMGNLTISGGIVNVAAASGTGGGADTGNIWLNPYGTYGASSLNLDGGTLNTARSIANGSGSSSSVTFNGGTFLAAASVNIGASTGAINVSGGTINTQSFSVGVSTPLLHGTGTPDGGLTKLGTGNLTLSVGNTFTGDLVISGGTLTDPVAANNGTPTSTGLGNMTIAGRQVRVNPGATLAFTNNDSIGSATVLQNTSIVVNGGTMNHGSYFVTLPNLTLQNGAVLNGGNGVASTHQTFNLMGSVTVGGTAGSSIVTVGTSNTGVHLGSGNTNFIVGSTGAGPDLTVAVSLIDRPGGGVAGTLTKTGAGLMLLTAANAYTGSTVVNGGVLQASTTATLPGYGTGGKLSVGASGTLAVTGSNWSSAAVGAIVTANSGGFASGSALAIDTAGGNYTLSNRLAGSMGLKTMGNNVLSLSAANTHSGATTLSSGTLQLADALAVQNSTLVAVGGVLDVNGLSATAGGLSGTGNLALNSGTLSVGNNAANTTYSGNLTGSAPLIKIGGGKLTLAGSNGYSGAVTVNVGKLYVNGSLTAASGISVAAGATLGGSGGATAATLAAGAAVEGGAAGLGTLTLNSLSFTGSGTFGVGDYSVYPNSQSNAALYVTGSNGLTTGGGSGSVTVNVGGPLPGAGSQTYHLLQYSGSLGSGFDTFILGTTPGGARKAYALVDNPGYLDLNITADTPYWTGANGSAWSGQNNWWLSVANTATEFQTGDTVAFDDRATGSLTASVTADVNPTSVAFSGTNHFTIQGSNAIAGSATVSIAGPGTVTIQNANSYSGTTTLSGGALQIGSTAALGTGALEVNAGTLSADGASARSFANATTLGGNATLGDATNNGPLTLSGSLNLGGATRTLTINSPVTLSGTVFNGGLTKNGGDALTLTGSNIHAGGTTLNAGALRVGHNAALGSGLLTINGGTLSSNGATARTIANPVSIGGNAALGSSTDNGALTLSGSITVSGSPVLTLSSSVLVSGPLNLGGASPTLDLAVPATVSGVISNGGLTKAGSGQLTLIGGNTFAGSLVISGGTLKDTLQANNGNPLATGIGDMTAGGRTVTVNSGAMLVFDASDAMGSYQYNSPVSLAADGGTIANATSRFMSIPAITLQNGGTLLTANGANPAFQSFNLRGAITVSGTSGSFIAARASGNNGVHLGGTTIAATTFNVAATGDPTADLTVSAPLLNEVYNVGSLTKSGAGLMVSTTANSYTGTTLVTGGSLHFAAGSSLASAGNITTQSGGVLVITGTVTQANNKIFAAGSGISNTTGTIIVNSGAVVNLGGTSGNASATFIGGSNTGSNGNYGAGTLTINGGAVNIAAGGTGSSGVDATKLWLNPYGKPTSGASALNLNGGTLTTARQIADGGSAGATAVNFNGGVLRAGSTDTSGGFLTPTAINVLDGGAILDTNGYDITISRSLLASGSGGLTKQGAGTLALTASSSYAGGTTINAGALSVTSDNQLGNTSGTVNFGGGSMLVGGTGTAFASGRSFVLNSSGTIDAGNAANAAALSGPANVGANTLTLQGDGNGTYSGNIAGSTGGVTKAGAGTWVLAGSDTYAGATTVNGGKLYFNGSSSSGTVSLAGGATLGGFGSVSGAVTVASGGSIDAGYNGAGQLTLGGLSFTDSAAIHIGGKYLTPAVNVAGPLAASGGTGSAVINIDGLLAENGAYSLIGYSGGSIGGTGSAAFAVGAHPILNARQTGTLEDTGSQLLWNVVGGHLIWTGTGTAFSGGNNWKLSTDNSVTDFLPGDSVVFDDSATGFVVDISGTGDVSPSWMTFNHSGSYSLQGSRGVVGIAGLTKSGVGTLLITNSNGFTGGSTLNAGLVQVGVDAALGSGAVVLNGAALSSDGATTRTIANAIAVSASTVLGDATNNGTLALSGSIGLGGGVRTLTVNSPVTTSGAISNGGLIKAGSGTVTLAGSSDYAGGTTLDAGSLWIGHNAALGSGTLTLNFGALASDGAIARSLANPVVIGGNVVLGDATNNGTLALSGPIGLGGGVRTVTVNSPVTASGAISNGGLIKAGSAALVLTGASSFAGGTTLNAGALQIGHNSALGSGTLTLNAGVLSSDGAAARSVANAVVLGGNVILGDAVNNGALTLAGPFGLGGATRTLEVASGVTISGQMTNGGLTKTGSGTLVLASNNTYSGPTTVNAGTLQIGDGLTLHANYYLYSGGAGTVTVNAGGTLLFRSIDALGSALIPNPNIQVHVTEGGLVVNGAWTGTYGGPTSAGFNSLYGLRLSGGTLRGVGALNGHSGTIAWGAFNLSGTLLIDGTAQSTISQAAPGDGDYLGPNGFMGLAAATTTFNVLDTAAGTDLLVAAALRNFNSGTSGLTKTGAGTMVLAASDNNYTGATTLVQGALVLTGSLATGSGANSVSLSPASGNVASLSVSGGALSITTTAAPSLRAGTVSGGSAAVNVTGGVLTTSNEVWIGTTAEAHAEFNVSGGSTTINNWLAIGRNGNDASLTITGGAVNVAVNHVTIGAFAADVGQAIVSGGTLNAANSIYVGENGAGTLTVSGSGQVVSGAALYLGHAGAGGGTVNLDGGTLTSLGIATLGSGTSTLNFNSGTLKASASNGGFLGGLTGAHVRNGGAVIDSNGFEITVGQALAHSTIGGDNAVDGGLTKNGAGRLTLAAANTFNGDTTVNGGTLALNHGLALQNSTLDTNAAGTVDLSALTSGTLGGIRGAGSLGIVVASPVSLSVGNNHTDTTFSGSIPAGINALSKIGSGSLTLTGTIVAAGAGSVDAGMLVVGGSLQANSLNVNGAARISGSGVLDSVGESFLYASSASSEFAGSVVGAQALEVSNGILTLSGSNTFSGGTAVYSTGVLVLNAAEAILDGTSLTVGDAGAFAPIVPDAAIAPREAVGPPVAAVPESGTLGLLLAGAAVLWWWRSRRFAGRP